MKISIVGPVVVLAGVAATLALAGCSSNGTSTPGRSTSPSVTSAASAPAPASSPTSGSEATTDGNRPVSLSGHASSAARPITADPSRYHVGSVGPGSPRTYDAHTVSFRTPSHNIACTEIADGTQITCQTAQHTFASAPRPASCGLNWLGSDVVLGTGRASMGVCAGNPVVLEDSAVLPYGYRLTFGTITCTSESAALSCVAGDHGFTLDRTRVALH